VSSGAILDLRNGEGGEPTGMSVSWGDLRQ